VIIAVSLYELKIREIAALNERDFIRCGLRRLSGIESRHLFEDHFSKKRFCADALA
jgi:hypothetical protein